MKLGMGEAKASFPEKMTFGLTLEGWRESPRRRGWGWVLLAEGTARMESSVGKRKYRPLRARWQKQMAK